jgi:drug/metabolite transporter (DMT)-like permease
MSGSSNHWRDRPAAVYAAAVFALVLWAGTPIANKIAVAAIDPATAGLLRSALAGLASLLLAWLWRLPFPAGARQRTLLALSSIGNFVAWPWLLSVGLGFTTANHAALMIATIPVFTGLMAATVDRIRLGFAWFAGVTISLCGTALLIGVRADIGSAAAGSVIGDLIILLGVLACAAGYVAGGKLAPQIGTFPTTFWGLGTANVILVPALALLWARTGWSGVGAGAWLAVAYMALCSSFVGYIAWFWALGRGGITRISSWQLGQPVLTVVAAGVLLGERVTWPLAVAGFAVLIGTALTQLAPRPQP